MKVSDVQRVRVYVTAVPNVKRKVSRNEPFSYHIDWPQHKKMCTSLKEAGEKVNVSSKSRDIDRTASKEYIFSHLVEIDALYTETGTRKDEAVVYIDMRNA